MNYLTSEQINKLKQKLDEDRSQVLDDAREKMRLTSKEVISDLTSDVGDVGDESIAELFIGMDNAIIVRRLRQLQEIDSALQRIETEKYGICINCGCDIGYERLSVYPSATRCILCQSQREKTFAHEPRLSL